MKITMGRKLNTAPYEIIEFGVEVEGDDLVELQLRAYKAVLNFELHNRSRTRDECVDAYRRYSRILGVPEEG